MSDHKDPVLQETLTVDLVLQHMNRNYYSSGVKRLVESKPDRVLTELTWEQVLDAFLTGKTLTIAFISGYDLYRMGTQDEEPRVLEDGTLEHLLFWRETKTEEKFHVQTLGWVNREAGAWEANMYYTWYVDSHYSMDSGEVHMIFTYQNGVVTWRRKK